MAAASARWWPDLLNVWSPVFDEVLDDLSWLTAWTWWVPAGITIYTPICAGLALPCSSIIFPIGTWRIRRPPCSPRVARWFFLRQGLVMPLWPLISYAAPRGMHTGQAVKPVPQVYLRRGPARLEMTPIGSEEACQSVADEKALGVFLELFRLKEVEAKKDFRVRDFLVKSGRKPPSSWPAQELTAMAYALKQAVDEGDDQRGSGFYGSAARRASVNPIYWPGSRTSFWPRRSRSSVCPRKRFSMRKARSGSRRKPGCWPIASAWGTNVAARPRFSPLPWKDWGPGSVTIQRPRTSPEGRKTRC